MAETVAVDSKRQKKLDKVERLRKKIHKTKLKISKELQFIRESTLFTSKPVGFFKEEKIEKNIAKSHRMLKKYNKKLAKLNRQMTKLLSKDSELNKFRDIPDSDSSFAGEGNDHGAESSDDDPQVEIDHDSKKKLASAIPTDRVIETADDDLQVEIDHDSEKKLASAMPTDRVIETADDRVRKAFVEKSAQADVEECIELYTDDSPMRKMLEGICTKTESEEHLIHLIEEHLIQQKKQVCDQVVDGYIPFTSDFDEKVRSEPILSRSVKSNKKLVEQEVGGGLKRMKRYKNNGGILVPQASQESRIEMVDENSVTNGLVYCIDAPASCLDLEDQRTEVGSNYVRRAQWEKPQPELVKSNEFIKQFNEKLHEAFLRSEQLEAKLKSMEEVNQQDLNLVRQAISDTEARINNLEVTLNLQLRKRQLGDLEKSKWSIPWETILFNPLLFNLLLIFILSFINFVIHQ